MPRVGIRDAHAAAALEVMSRFAIDPHWLLYLPPTMSPVATQADGDLLEHPDQAFSAYRADGVAEVVCEEKHMGSRAVVLVCRSAPPRHGFSWPASAAPASTGPRRRLDQDRAAVLPAPADVGAPRPASARRPRQAGLFAELDTSWLLLDAELLPWNVKAGQLLRDQYAAVGAAALASLPAAASALEQAVARGLPGVGELLDRTRSRRANADAFTAAYLRYCWATDGLAGVRVAPFQLLATEGAVYHDRPHLWHLALADRLAAADPELISSPAGSAPIPAIPPRPPGGGRS